MYANVLVEVLTSFSDKVFTYVIPSSLKEKVFIGQRVLVPFGKKEYEGFVLSLTDEKPNYELKKIINVVDNYKVLNEELLALGKRISIDTITPLITCYQAMLPLALKAKNKINMKEQYDTFITLNEVSSFDKLNKTQEKIINILKSKKRVLKKELTNISNSSVKTLLNKNIIKEEKDIKYRFNLENEKYKKHPLLPFQIDAYTKIVESLNNNKTFLLYGVTGSGKTNIYMEVIERVIKDNKQALVLVPEISLTPQIIKRFATRFKRIAILHSGLSDGEKYDEWRKINNNEVDIVIGARSACFAPLKNIGVIIVDEEHSTTYKQENMPRYNAIDVLKLRSLYHQCPLILGSATPSLESFARAKKGVYELLELKIRANNMPMPKVKIIDMNKEMKTSNNFLSKPLIDKINETIKKNEQVILFLNRRGYSNFLTCRGCGNVEKCPNCDISLTYHKTSNMLRCHYCGYADKKKDYCTSCSEEMTDYGMGTEKIEEVLNKIIDNAKVVRMDIDTTTKKNAHKKIIEDFQNQKYNILLGTQMIAKGLDFPRVTLVGIINADISLNIPDFRSSEYTFQLINQVSGRSGRSNLPGEVYIQTFNKDHYAIFHSKNYDYDSFYQEEMKIRKTLSYSPYYYLVSIKVISSNYEDSSIEANKIKEILNKSLKSTIMLGPSVANPFKLNNKYRFQIILKYKKEENLKQVLFNILETYYKNKKVKIEVDFNPVKF